MNNAVKKLFSIVIFCCFVVFQMNAQSNDLLDKANKYYELQDYKQAIATYLKVLEANPNEGAVFGKLANAYRMTNNLNEASVWYAKAVKTPGADPESFFQYGLVFKMLGKYENANAYFTEYSKINAVKGQAYSKSCEFAKNRVGDTPFYTVTKENISSAAADFAPTLYKGNVLYASARTDMKNEMNDKDDRWKTGDFNQLLRSKPDANGTLGKPTVLKTSFKAKTNEGPLAFTADGKIVAYTSNQFVNGIRQVPEAGSKMRIYIATVTADDEWKKPEPFTYNKPEEYNTGYPSFTKDGAALYFASDMPGGHGGMDIYVCFKTGDSWSGPQNLGPNLNTPGDEIAPFIDGAVLYFSSNYLPGFGGMDIFRAEQANGLWDRILHLGTGVNTSLDDYGLVFDQESGYGYMTSNRAGNEDIYKVKVTSERVEIVVLNENGQSIDGAKIDFSSCGDNAVYTDNRGRFKFRANSGLDCKGVVVSKNGYDSKTISVSSANKDLRLIEVRLNRTADTEGHYIGTVLDLETKTVLGNVQVKVTNLINQTTSATTTDVQGRYTLNLEPKTTYDIKYTIANYVETSRRVMVGDGSDKTILGVQGLESKASASRFPDGYDFDGGTKTGQEPNGNYTGLPDIAYDVQFGVFSEADKNKFNELRAFGFIYSQKRAGDSKAYKVGAFKTREEAEAIKEKLKEKGYEGAFVTTITSKYMLSRVLIGQGETKPPSNNPPGGSKTPPTPPAPSSNLVYKLQLGAYNNPDLFDKSTVEGLGKLSYLPVGEVTLILLGEFPTYEAAKAMEEKLKEKGLGAMVVAIQNGQKVPLGKVNIK